MKNGGYRPPNWGDGTDFKSKYYVCDKEGHSWMTCAKKRRGNGCARYGLAAHRLRDCLQRTNGDRKNSTQTDKSDPLAFMIETKLMEVAGALAGAKLLYYPLQIRQKRIRALLDSGASVNCIDKALVRHVSRCLSRKLPGTFLYLDRRKTLVRGTTELEVRGPGY